MIDPKLKDFAIHAMTGCKSHDEWLALMAFGLETLLQDQTFFLDLVMQEAQKGEGAVVENAVSILKELGVHFVVTPA